MAKLRGGNRILKKHSKEWEQRKNETDKMKKSGEYSEVYFDYETGGYYAVEKSSAKHKPEELEVASFLAKKGYKVTLTSEAGMDIRAEGYIFSSKYEQRTPELSPAQKKGIAIFDPVSNFKNALGHARDKWARNALIYMKHDLHTRESVEKGIEEFEKTSKWRFDTIYVVTKDGRIHKHVHNK